MTNPVRLYKHYKGEVYEVITEGKMEAKPALQMVVYRCKRGDVWIRPASEFFGLVGRHRRFEPILDIYNPNHEHL